MRAQNHRTVASSVSLLSASSPPQLRGGHILDARTLANVRTPILSLFHSSPRGQVTGTAVVPAARDLGFAPLRITDCPRWARTDSRDLPAVCMLPRYSVQSTGYNVWDSVRYVSYPVSYRPRRAPGWVTYPWTLLAVDRPGRYSFVVARGILRGARTTCLSAKLPTPRSQRSHRHTARTRMISLGQMGRYRASRDVVDGSPSELGQGTNQI